MICGTREPQCRQQSTLFPLEDLNGLTLIEEDHGGEERLLVVRHDEGDSEVDAIDDEADLMGVRRIPNLNH